MQIHSATFVTSAAQPKQFLTRPIPHFVFAGRSNVGKSSLINALLNRKGLAKTSQTPGKTRLINYFLINDRFFFVDIPGYGYAQVSKKARHDWGKLIETYLSETPYLALILQLMDLRHDPSKLDLQMFEWLKHSGHPFLLLLTKADKLSRNQVNQNHRKIVTSLGIEPHHAIPTSAQTGLGIAEVWKTLNEACQVTQERITQEF